MQVRFGKISVHLGTDNTRRTKEQPFTATENEQIDTFLRESDQRNRDQQIHTRASIAEAIQEARTAIRQETGKTVPVNVRYAAFESGGFTDVPGVSESVLVDYDVTVAEINAQSDDARLARQTEDRINEALNRAEDEKLGKGNVRYHIYEPIRVG